MIFHIIVDDGDVKIYSKNENYPHDIVPSSFFMFMWELNGRYIGNFWFHQTQLSDPLYTLEIPIDKHARGYEIGDIIVPEFKKIAQEYFI